ncbi:HAD family hydrolase [Salibacterium lacus]|uniref:HAD family hydrolase n=1 Tax=Salibacterium lacus TaxID=1898109 RepID=A0ABW5T2G4_9BACI
MAFSKNTIRIAVFDLDGTLYEDTTHFRYYAERLAEKLPADKQPLFWHDYSDMLEGNHPVAVGRVYDAANDRVLEVDPASYRVTKVWNWEGKETGEEDAYTTPVAFDFDSMIAVGDGWWLPAAAAKHHGTGSTFDAYQKTKAYMQTEDFQFTEDPGRRFSLQQLGGQMHLILLTNSQADDVGQLLRTLDLEGVFDEVIPEAAKPARTEAHFSTILKKYEAEPGEVVSIGDNYLNDIVPAENLGMASVLIDPLGKTPVRSETKRITTLRELFPLLRG